MLFYAIGKLVRTKSGIPSLICWVTLGKLFSFFRFFTFDPRVKLILLEHLLPLKLTSQLDFESQPELILFFTKTNKTIKKHDLDIITDQSRVFIFKNMITSLCPPKEVIFNVKTQHNGFVSFTVVRGTPEHGVGGSTGGRRRQEGGFRSW